MRTRYKNKCFKVLPIGLILAYGPFIAVLAGAEPHPLYLVAIVPGFFLYIWGCPLLAKAKGLSQAILLTVVLGGIVPFLILLVLEDKNWKRV